MKIKSIVTKFINSLLGSVLAMLGFSACSNSQEEDMEMMYGTPYGEFKASGLVENENAEPIAGARVITRQYRFDEFPGGTDINGFLTREGCDTTYTDAKGHYAIDGYASMTWHEIEFVVEDPTGEYAADCTIVGDLKYEGASGWNMGTAKPVVNFILKKADKKE